MTEWINAEFHTLSDVQKKLVVDVAHKVAHGESSASSKQGDDEYYSYRHGNGLISWGINGGEFGFCIARGLIDEDTFPFDQY